MDSENLSKKVEAHYFRKDIFQNILDQLKDGSVDLDNITRDDISGIDELHVRGAEVSLEMAGYLDFNSKRILDVGSGLGGSSRMLADKFDCHVTGIDLTREFVDAANKLSELLGLDRKTEFIQANATELPFEDSVFDIVWTQHVQMNIEAKHKFYSEIVRVLKPGGAFVYYDIFKRGNAPVMYPMPWSDTADMSFLFPKEEFHRILMELGMRSSRRIDQTEAGIAYFEGIKNAEKEDSESTEEIPKAMGEGLRNKLMNLLDHLKNSVLEIESGVFVKNSLR